MKTILFQGDSITDAGRSRTDFENYRGFGYATLVAAALGYERPGEFRYLNLGISGNRTCDLLARVKTDFIAEAPDFLSILIGVNDVWHEFHEHPNGVSAEWFETYYDLLLTQIKAACPQTRMMILEPFVLCGPATADKYDTFRKEVELRAAASRRIADKHGCLFVPLQEKFDALAKQSGETTHWLLDGVHPTAMGHEMIKNEWIRAFRELEK